MKQAGAELSQAQVMLEVIVAVVVAVQVGFHWQIDWFPTSSDGWLGWWLDKPRILNISSQVKIIFEVGVQLSNKLRLFHEKVDI